MRKYLRSALAGLGVGLTLFAAVALNLAPIAYALTIPPTFAPRYFPWQVTHYSRHLITVSSTGIQVDNGPAANFTAGSASVKVGAIPYNSFVVRGYQQVVTACNAGTTCTLAVGTASGGGQLVAAQPILSAGGSTALTIVAANAGIAATGNNIAQTGADGGFDLYVTVAQTGAVATAGTVVLVLEYFANNDGACTPGVPFPGGTAGPC
jgi:hypothetical protein